MVILFPVGVGMGQTAVGMGDAAVGVCQHIPFYTADLVHIIVTYHHFHRKVGIEDPFQALCGHQAVRNFASGTAMVIVDGFPAHTVGNGQPAPLFQKTCQHLE